MDGISGLLDGPRARSAFVLRCVMAPPWSMRIVDEVTLTVIAPLGEPVVITHDGDGPTTLAGGDLALIVGHDPYTLSDRAGRAPTVLVDERGDCQTLQGEPLVEALGLGVRTWGTGGPHDVLIGSYRDAGQVSGPLLSALPRLMVLRADEYDDTAVRMLAAESARDEPGQDTVLDRLLDLSVVVAIRAWLARHEDEVPGWWRGRRDPVVGRALGLIHHSPEQPWTLAGLASQAVVSRATLARRFADLVGQPPMGYLSRWRLAMAADLLHDPELTLDVIAHRVGYGSGFAMSAAFKREHGLSPREYRAAAAR